MHPLIFTRRNIYIQNMMRPLNSGSSHSYQTLMYDRP